MAITFESPNFLVSQTRENLDEFVTVTEPIFAGNCYSNVVEVDPLSGNKSFKIKFNRNIPARARHIATTAISDLRHALDQATCTAFELINNAKPENLYFPFTASPNDLLGRLRKSMPEEIHPTFISFMPYPTGEGYDGGNTLLSNFGKAAGPNKHRVSCNIGGKIVGLRADSITGIDIINLRLPPKWDTVMNELVVGTTKTSGHIKYNFGVDFYIALSEAGPLTGSPAFAVLHALADQVEKIVSTIEQETKRLISNRSK